jgi:hypothetical protein
VRISDALRALVCFTVVALMGCSQADSTPGLTQTSADSGVVMDAAAGGGALDASNGGALETSNGGSLDAANGAEDVGLTWPDASTEDAADAEDEGGGAPDTPAPPECPDAAPEAPDVPVCMAWECDVEPPPTCWSCSVVASDEGEACVVADTGAAGTCDQGLCLSAPDPGQPGGLPFVTTNHELELEGGGLFPQSVALTLYLPQAAGPFPVVVFHHGFQLDAALYASVGEHLAGWGYVVVLPQMPGGLIGGPNHTDLKEHLITLLDWIEAEAAGTGGAFGGKADATLIGLAGHSMGGKIAMLAATEDSRPLAIFGVDPVDAAGGPLAVSAADYPSVTPELMDQLTVPIGLMGETTNATSSGIMGQACAPEDDNFHQYYEHATSPAIEIDVIGASHMSFLDDPDCGMLCSVCPSGTDDTATTRLLMRRYMTAFFHVFLRGEDSYRLYLTGAAMDDDVDAGLVVSATKNAF